MNTTITADLTLQVSDGKDSNGNADASVDDVIAVRMAVTDVAEPVGITLTAPATATVGQYVTLRAALGDNPPVPEGEMDFVWVRRSPGGTNDWREETGAYADVTITNNRAGVKQYKVFGKYLHDNIWKTVESDWVEVTWTQP